MSLGWIVNYGVVTTHASGTGQPDLPLDQLYKNQVQVNLILLRDMGNWVNKFSMKILPKLAVFSSLVILAESLSA